MITHEESVAAQRLVSEHLTQAGIVLSDSNYNNIEVAVEYYTLLNSDDPALDYVDPALGDVAPKGRTLIAYAIDFLIYDAIHDGDLNVVKQYVDLGANVNSSHFKNWTPLMFAATHNNPAIFDYLLSQGADYLAVNTQGQSILMWTGAAGDPGMVETLLARKVPMNVRDSDGNTALTWACGCNENAYNRSLGHDQHAQVVDFLLDAGSEVDPVNRHGRTPLMAASRHGSARCVQALLNRHADVNLADQDDNTALLMACDYGRTEVVALLVDQMANVNTVNRKGQTPLMLAAANGDARSVRLLLNHGADVQCQDHQGNTVADYAIRVNVGDILEAAGVQFPAFRHTDAKVATDLDYAMYSLTLAHLRQEPTFHHWHWSQEQGELGPCLITETRIFHFFEIQRIDWMIEHEGQTEYIALPDVWEDVQRRNKRTVALPDYRPGFEVRAFSFEESHQLFQGENPCKCIFEFALPGYSKDGKTACVFFWYINGNRRESGHGIYCLQRTEGVWRVEWKQIVGYR